MSETFTWQENALYLVTVPALFLLALLVAEAAVKVAKWWAER